MSLNQCYICNIFIADLYISFVLYICIATLYRPILFLYRVWSLFYLFGFSFLFLFYQNLCLFFTFSACLFLARLRSSSPLLTLSSIWRKGLEEPFPQPGLVGFLSFMFLRSRCIVYVIMFEFLGNCWVSCGIVMEYNCNKWINTISSNAS